VILALHLRGQNPTRDGQGRAQDVGSEGALGEAWRPRVALCQNEAEPSSKWRQAHTSEEIQSLLGMAVISILELADGGEIHNGSTGPECKHNSPIEKRLLTLIEDLVEVADVHTAKSRNRNESTEEHHPSRNSVFKRPQSLGQAAEQNTK